MVRDFVGYGSNPPRVEWPGGARLALNLVINYEEGSELGALETDPQREMMAEFTYPAKPNERELVNESVFEYGSRVGVWRIMRILDKYKVTCTIFACALALERNPEVTQAFVKHGYDMVGHGYRWIPHYGMSEAQEREQIRMARESIERTTGQRIVGWFTRPLQTLNTRRILAGEGFLYDSGCFNDDLPYFEQIGNNRFLVVPYTLDQNDIRFGDSLLDMFRLFEVQAVLLELSLEFRRQRHLRRSDKGDWAIELGQGIAQRMHGAHAHVANRQPLQPIDPPFLLQDSVQVGQNLGGMLTPAITAVNNRDGSPFRGFVRGSLLKMAHDDHIAVKLEHFYRVFNRFLVKISSAGHLGIRESGHMPTQAVHGRLVGQARSGARLVESCHQSFLSQHGAVSPALGNRFQLFSYFENMKEFQPLKIFQ